MSNRDALELQLMPVTLVHGIDVHEADGSIILEHFQNIRGEKRLVARTGMTPETYLKLREDVARQAADLLGDHSFPLFQNGRATN